MKKYRFILEFESELDRKKFFKEFWKNSDWKRTNAKMSMYFENGR